MKLTRVLCTHILVVLCRTIHGQYALGVRAGFTGFFMPLELGAKDATTGSGPAFGLTLHQLQKEGTAFRMSLDLQKRSYYLDQFNGFTNRREQLQMDQLFVAFSTEVRWRLSSTQQVYFDFGPMIGAQLAERANGIAFTEGYRTNDTITVTGDSRSKFVINDVRLRFGPSADFSLGERFHFTSLLSIAPGWGDWFRNKGRFNVDLQALVGFGYVLSVAKSPPTLQERHAHFFPMNSKLTELMQ